MKRSSVTLEQMLDARERRAQAQKELLLHADGNACLVSLSLNIAGSVKRTPKTRLLFDRAMKVFESFGFHEISRRVTDEITGTEALILLGVDSKTAAKDACRIEHDLSESSFTKIKKHMKEYKAQKKQEENKKK